MHEERWRPIYQAKQPHIFLLWHEALLPLLWQHRRQNVAIVVSGSSATREYIQRLGRVLRPKPREAVLYEIVSRRTTEGRAARARRPGGA
jgi:hypothetical protein